ncbi:MAG: esterase [Acidobacteria bacterium]|nr:esterase [Acidobacteriota bacterium]
MGELIIETFSYDGGRQVTVYVPTRPVQAVIFCGDGQLIPHWGNDLETQPLPATMIVGVHRLADETLRLHEYSPNFDPSRFKAHEEFLMNDVRSWISSRFKLKLAREHTAVCGVSAGGELALALGARHPDVFGAILSASPGAGFRPTDEITNVMPPTYLVAGTQEPFFLENALRWAIALRKKGKKVVLKERDAGHDQEMWRAELPQMIAWAFAR